MSRVFVVAPRRDMNLSDAERFGAVVHLTDAARIDPRDIYSVISEIRTGLSVFREDDYLLPVGEPVLIAAAAILAAKAAGLRRVRLLRWDPESRRYHPVRVDVPHVPELMEA